MINAAVPAVTDVANATRKAVGPECNAPVNSKTAKSIAVDKLEKILRKSYLSAPTFFDDVRKQALVNL